MTEGLIDKLEAFQGELVKRVLSLAAAPLPLIIASTHCVPNNSSNSLRRLKHHSNTAAITALEKPTMRSRLFPAAGDGEQF